MAAQQKKILFITPGAESFGGNIVLLHFLRWLKENSSIPFVTLFGNGGDLSGEFDALSKTFQFYYPDKSERFTKKAFSKSANHLELKRLWLKPLILKENIGLIYSNAVINHRMLSMFANPNIPVISHCHELEGLIQLIGIENFNYTKKRTSEFIAVSDAVRQNLIKNHQIPDDKINVIHEFIQVKNFADDEFEKSRKMLSAELDIPGDAFIVGASGTLNWNKAPEFFVQIAREVFWKNPEAPIYFVWIGGAEKNSAKMFRMNHEIEKSGLDNRVFFLEHKSNPLEYYAALDVFAMVSRQDSFPLVCLESASLEKPIICFDKAGGMPEFVEQDCGFTVPYFDLNAFAEKIFELYKNPELKKKLGKNAAQKVASKANVEISAPKILKIIEKYI